MLWAALESVFLLSVAIFFVKRFVISTEEKSQQKRISTSIRAKQQSVLVSGIFCRRFTNQQQAYEGNQSVHNDELVI